MNSEKKVHIVIAMPMILQGGTEVHTLSLLRVLVRLGYAVTVCCYYEYQDAMVSCYETTGARVLLLKRKRNIASRGTLSELFSLLIALRKTFSSLRPDILHVQYVAPGFVPIIAGRLAGIKTMLATVHTSGDVGSGAAAKYLLRLSARLCSHFICVSKSAGEYWFGKCEIFDPMAGAEGKKHFAIYNGVDFISIRKRIGSANKRKLRQELKLKGAKTIGTVGRLVTLKGHAVLLKAMKEVIERYPAAALAIIGDGSERGSLERMATELGVASKICWLGEQSQEKVFELLAMMDIFAVPSMAEGFGLTAAEAMAAGLPVVASDVGGLREVVEHNTTGCLVPAGNSSALAQALLTMLDDPTKARKMGRAGRERVKNNYSVEAFAVSFAALYRQLGKAAVQRKNP